MHYAETTEQMIKAHKVMAKPLEDKYHASGLIIKVTDLSNNVVCDSFCIRGEDFKPIRQELTKAIRECLDMRLLLLDVERGEIQKILTD